MTSRRAEAALTADLVLPDISGPLWPRGRLSPELFFAGFAAALCIHQDSPSLSHPEEMNSLTFYCFE